MATTTYGTPYVSGTDLVANWPAASLTVANSIDAAGYYIGRGINAQTASYTGVLTDAGKVITMSNASVNTVTIPANSSVAYVIGTRINILNLGAGACTPTAAAGVTINGTITALATNSSAAVIKTATNTWSYIAAGGGGKVLQVVNFTYNTVVNTTSATYTTTNLTLAITPASASNKVLVTVFQNGVGKDTPSGSAVGLKLFRDATDLLTFGGAEAYTQNTDTNYVGSAGVTYLDSPATTSATTYSTKLNSGNNVGNAGVQKSSATSSITLMEISA